MKIHNKGSSKGKDWSFFGKALLWSTALIFVSCGFNTEKKQNNNIGDFVDFVSLGISVEEKAPTSFGLSGGFNLAAGNLTCDRIDYSWSDSASGYNPSEINMAIEKVKFIDNDQFKLRITKFWCKEGGDSEYLEFAVEDLLPDDEESDGQNYTDGEVRLYKNDDRADLEVTQANDCSAGCSSGSSIEFSLTNFNLDAGTENVADVSYQEEVGITFTNGEPIPAFDLRHVEHLNASYNPTTGAVELGHVWECQIADTTNTGNDAECSGQLISNLSIVILDGKSIAPLDSNGDPQIAFDSANDPLEGDADEVAANKAVNRQAEIVAAIEFRDRAHDSDDSLGEAQNLTTPGDNHMIPAGGTGENATDVVGAFGDGGADTTLTNHGVKGHSLSEPGFYDNLSKYACIYSVGQKDDGSGKDYEKKLGAKCQKVVFAPITEEYE